MKNNLFDTFIKEHLGAARPEVPPHVWENIIAKKDRKKPVGYFTNNITKMAAAVLFILTSAGAMFYLLSQKNISKSKQVTVIKNNSNKTNNTITNNDNTLKDKLNDQTKEQNNTNGTTLKDEAGTSNIFKYHSNASTTIVINAGDVYNENRLTEVLNNNEQTLTGKYLSNNLIHKSYSFNPTLQFYTLPKTPAIPCPEAERNTSGNKKYIEIYGGPDYVFRSYSDDTANSVYLQQRKASVKYQFAYSAGIRYTKVFGSGMSIRTGVNYSQINEKFKSENGRITQNVYIINSNGDTTGSYAQTGTQYKTSTNKYKSIDIPISVGYELGNGRLHANVNAGATINISSSQKGFMLDYSGDAVDISSGKSSSVYQYKTKAGVSFIAATSIYYKLNEKLHVMAEPYVKLSLSPMTKPEISLREKFHTAGLRLGVRMDL